MVPVVPPGLVPVLFVPNARSVARPTAVPGGFVAPGLVPVTLLPVAWSTARPTAVPGGLVPVAPMVVPVVPVVAAAAAILREAGYTDDEIADLKSRQVI